FAPNEALSVLYQSRRLVAETGQDEACSYKQACPVLQGGFLTAADEVLLYSVLFLSDAILLIGVESFSGKLTDAHQAGKQNLTGNLGDLMSQRRFPCLQVLPLLVQSGCTSEKPQHL